MNNKYDYMLDREAIYGHKEPNVLVAFGIVAAIFALAIGFAVIL